ncbi:hypothetical protein HNV12_01280 [Methanococcoides sp. SA1]|nr:hypothetical protein [Methanococcoides sp. SA1]
MQHGDTNAFLHIIYKNVFEKCKPHLGTFFENLVLTEFEAKILSEKDIIDSCKEGLNAPIRSYTINMIREALEYGTHNRELGERKLDMIWAKYKGQKFAKKSGLKRKHGKLLASLVKKSLLENFFNKPVTITMEGKQYSVDSDIKYITNKDPCNL